MRLDDGGLLAALHEGLFEQPLWHGFLEKFRARVGAPLVSLAFKPVDQETIVELYAGAPMALHRLSAEKHGRVPLPFGQMREARVYTLQELVDMVGPVQQRERAEILAKLGITSMRSVRVTEPGGMDAWLSCADDQEVGPAVSALLAALVPHLRIALRGFVAFNGEKSRPLATSEAFAQSHSGWLTLDVQCRIVDMAPHLEQFFQRSSVLRRGRYDRLMPASPAIDRELTRLVKSFAGSGSARSKAISLSRDPLIDMLVRPVRDRPLSVLSPPVAMVYISSDRWSQADRCDHLIDLFDLLPSEARLAWAIAQGLSISEAAAHLGLTLETARGYSKQVYAKMCVRGQAELVRQIFLSTTFLG